MNETKRDGCEGWVILELMGHRRLAGMLREQMFAGATFVRIDVPRAGADPVTQFYAPAAVYCITPTDEETARRVAQGGQIYSYEAPRLAADHHRGDDAPDAEDAEDGPGDW